MKEKQQREGLSSDYQSFVDEMKADGAISDRDHQRAMRVAESVVDS